MKRNQKSTIFKGEKKHMDELDKAYRMRANHYGEMMLLKARVTARWEQFFQKHDFLICPMGFGPAYKHTKLGNRIPFEGKEINYGQYIWPFVACFNASGHPAITVPLGLGKDGLPIGVQIVGPY